MPHCIIEYSKDINIEPTTLINAVYKGALHSELFEDDHIKTRTTAYEHYQKGALKEKFVHVTAKILSGRNLEQRKMLSKAILSEVAKLDINAVTLTVEIVELEKESYSKKVL